MCVCTCACIYKYVYIHTNTQTDTHAHMYICSYIHTQDGVKQLEALIEVPLTNFAWSRDVYANVLWVAHKDCEGKDTNTFTPDI